MTEKYESKQQRINQSASTIFGVLSDFRNLTPAVADRLEDWSATENECSFKVKGFTARLAIVEKQSPTLIKIKGDDDSPVDFTFWIQLHEVSENDTRMRLVLHVEMNMMIKMMIGSKIAPAIDEMASRIATTFNSIQVG
jgi:carbon monoxide dehydrogenase subunit G